VDRLELLVARGNNGPRPAGDVETELLAITGAVSLGLIDDAAARAERLADRLASRARPAP
jgi:hypothetical protein